MVDFLFKRFLSLHFPRNPLPKSLSTTPPTSSDFTVHFLVTSCGLAPSAALSAAKSLRLDENSNQNPQSVLSLLKSHRFSPTHISAIISRRPSLLLSKPARNLAPKLHFLSTSSGIPASHLPDLLSSAPVILSRSLENHIKPTFDLLHSFLDSTDDLLLTLRRNRWFLCCNIRGIVAPNIALLMDRGVARTHIGKLLSTQPRTLVKPPTFFAEAVETVERLGMRPELLMFVHAVRAMAGMRKSTRVTRMELMRSLGWSDEEFAAAFRRAPLFLLVSEEKVRKVVDFLVNTVGLEVSDLSRRPKLLMYGLEKRIMPRFAVVQALEAKGLVRKGRGNKKVVNWMFTCTDKEFLDRYVRKYCMKVPELMDVLDGKIGLEAFCSKDGEVGRIVQS